MTGLRALQVALGAVCLYLAYATVAPALGGTSGFDRLPPPGGSLNDSFDTALAEQITKKDLFGGLAPALPVEDPTPGKDAEPSSKQFKLLGTMVSSLPDRSLAALMDIRRRESRFVRSGDPLESCSIERIERKRVVIDCNGKLEEFRLEEDDLLASASPGPTTRSAATPVPAPTRPISRSVEDRLEKIREARERNKEREEARARGLMQQAKITPSFGEDGSFQGIIINDAKPDGPLTTVPGILPT